MRVQGACTHPEEWKSIDGKCLVCGATDAIFYPSPIVAERQRLQMACQHPKEMVFDKVCFACGKEGIQEEEL